MAASRLFIRQLSRAWIIACCVCLPPLCNPGRAAAEERPHTIRLRHEPPQTKQLPPAGTLMPFAVQLENSTDVDIKIRLVGSRDGRFMDIAFPFGVLNLSDRPVYSIQVPAPVTAMTYQFIVHQPGGELTLTEKYIVKRNCVPSIPANAENAAEAPEYKREVATLVAQAKALESDNRNLETAIKLIEELKRDIPD